MANFVSAMSDRQIAYRHYLAHSWRWKLVRGVRLWLDGRQCRTCHERSDVEVHHASYAPVRMFPGAWLDVWSLTQEIGATICLCDKCHSAIHRNRSIVEFAD